MNKCDLELIRDYLDDRIDTDGLERLNRLLESDDDARAEFRAMATLEEGLRDLSVASEIPFPDHRVQSPENRIRVEHLGIAALLVLCLGLTVLSVQRTEREDEWGDAIARIDFLSTNVSFLPEQQQLVTEGSLLGKGWVQLERGRVRILFRSGVTVETEGPSAIGIDTPMRAYLDFGKVSVHAPESGRDFVVATESMEVVDLGTRFEVEVDPQSRESSVSVIEGLVDLHLGSRGAERMIRPLEAGYAARVDAFGEIVEMTDRKDVSTIGTADLLAHWKLDESGTSEEVMDASGNQLNGILRGKPESVSGMNGNALEFANGESVDLRKHIPALSRLDTFTFAAWVRDPSERLAVVFSLSGDSERHRVQFYLAKAFVRFGWQDGLHFDSISGRVDGWEPGQWYHVAMTLKNGFAHLYCDGEVIASGSVGTKIGTPISNPSQVKNANHAYLGWLVDGRQGDESLHQGFEGKLDDVQLYSGALGQDAIRFICEHPGQAWTP